MPQDAGMTGSVQLLDPVPATGHDSPPDRPTRPGRGLPVLVTGVLVVAVAAATWQVCRTVSDPVLFVCWFAGVVTLSRGVHALFRGARFRHLPPAAGRVVAIVAAHEPDPDELEACIRSIVDQRGVVVDEVHVVVEGPARRPVRPFTHPRVRWHRTEAGGRRAAQVHVLDRLEPSEWDFVLFVAGDRPLDEGAVEEQLRVFSQPWVAAAAGTVIVRDGGRNLLTRIADVHFGVAAARWTGRSLPGARDIVPGAPVLYRASVVFRHRRRPPAGFASDARFLTLYAAIEGEAAAARGSAVHNSGHLREGYRS
jgi:hyaluronan synthase